jgi:hypothetical protein
MRRLPLVALVVALAGCAKVEQPIDLEVAAGGIERLVATIDRGDLAVTGTNEQALVVEGESIGYGGGEGQAEHREEGNAVSLEVEGPDAVLEATSEFRRAWVDLHVETPAALDLDLWVKRGSVHVEGVEGRHVITGDRITAQALGGAADLLATAGGMDVDVRPWAESEVLLESSAGDAILRLPYGGPYDIEVIGDPAYEMVVEDLGFHTSWSDAGYFAGTVGDGSIRVVVYVSGGPFQLLESL